MHVCIYVNIWYDMIIYIYINIYYYMYSICISIESIVVEIISSGEATVSQYLS